MVFIGNVTGDDGLTAINIVWPIVAFITSLGTGIGVGGSVILNQMRGRKEHDAAEQIKATMIFLLAAVGIAASILFKLTYKPLACADGCTGTGPFVCCRLCRYYRYRCSIPGDGIRACCRSRNEQKTYFSMICCAVGLMVHLALDMLLVDQYRLMGVAVSTVVSQAVIMILCLLALRVRKRAKIDPAYLLKILAGSTSPLGINFVPSVVLLFTNYFALKAGGTAAVSAYAVMSYAQYIPLTIFFRGLRWSPAHDQLLLRGGGLPKRKRVLRSSAVILGVFSVIFVFLTPALISVMPKLFAVSDAAEEMMQKWFYPLCRVLSFLRQR